MVLLVSGCSQDGDFLFLQEAGADLPIWVRGNTDSRTFIVVVHGGPGNQAVRFGVQGYFTRLEAKYGLVLYDQRSSGTAQGNPATQTLTLDQFVTDLEKVIALINARYNRPTIFLMGHSWGGMLGTLYLLKGANQAAIRGWIEIDGTHNYPKTNELSRQWMMDYLTEKIKQGDKTKDWASILAFYQQNAVINTQPLFRQHVENMRLTTAYTYDANNPALAKFEPGWLDYITSPVGHSSDVERTQNALETRLSLNLSPQMNRITIPSLLLWGKQDGNVPAPIAQDAYDNLGTPVGRKSMVLINKAAHSPFAEQPEAFTDAVDGFIRKYQ